MIDPARWLVLSVRGPGGELSAEVADGLLALGGAAVEERDGASITWLLSDDSANVNGVVLASDGGWSVQ